MVNKKKFSIPNYFIFIISIGIIMTFILMFILNAFFISDPVQCKNINYVIKDSCISGSSLKLHILNSGNNTLLLSLGAKKYNTITSKGLQPGKIALYSIYFKKTIVKIVPVILSPSIAECKGKVQYVSVNLLGKCLN